MVEGGHMGRYIQVALGIDLFRWRLGGGGRLGGELRPIQVELGIALYSWRRV